MVVWKQIWKEILQESLIVQNISLFTKYQIKEFVQSIQYKKVKKIHQNLDLFLYNWRMFQAAALFAITGVLWSPANNNLSQQFKRDKKLLFNYSSDYIRWCSN